MTLQMNTTIAPAGLTWTAATGRNIVRWSCTATTAANPSQSGDGHVVMTVGNRALVGVVQGQGRGAEASTAAKRAVSEIREYIGDETLISVVRRCHARLRDTDGAALSLALFQPDNSTMTWIGIGNIEGCLLRARTTLARRPETLLLRAGVVGAQLPGLLTSTIPIVTGDVLVFTTQGIDRNFVEGLSVDDDPQRLCDSIVAHQGKGLDNALAIAVRYIG